MKRILTFILCLMMITCCVACKKDETIDKASNKNGNESVEKDSTDIPVADNEEEIPWGVTENIVVENNSYLYALTGLNESQKELSEARKEDTLPVNNLLVLFR